LEITGLIPHIEALIFASDKPLPVLEITDLLNNAFGFMDDKIALDQVEAAIEGIVEKYNSEFYPFEVVQSGGGWQFLTKGEYHKTVAQLNGDKFMKRLSAAALETLAIIAYKQPVTKGEIEAIRGVSADYAVQRLLEKELIIITGRNEKLPGHPLVYATSKSFMDYFGINSSDDLPKIKEVLSEYMVEPTPMQPQNEIDKSIDVSDEMPDAEAGVGDLEIEWETLEEENNRELANRLPNDSTENLENAIEGKPLAVSETGELIESNEDNAKDGLDSQGDDQNTDNTETD
jgi:segregation and condensation protein B